MIRTIEEKEIDKKFETLKQFCTNCTPDELDKLDAAYRYAAKVYGDKINSSGELLISHSLSVARIVAEEIGLRSVSLIAALLHDVINTADDNCEEIESKFGKDVATIVRGFKKVSVIDSEKVKLHSENFRSLFLSMIDDVRVIFIKIAHQLYDLRNYSSLTEFQKKIFLNDVQYLYIPITHRMGLYHIKAQLEDMAFRHSYPVEYSKIESRLHETKEQQEKYIEKFIRPIKEQFDKSGISYEIKSRAKSITSIKRKMEAQDIGIDKVYDLFAIRVILQNVLSDEDDEFIEDYLANWEKFGDQRSIKRKRIKEKEEQEDSSSENRKKQKDGKEKSLESINENQENEIKEFEDRKKRYLELINREKTACWQAYSLIANTYDPNPKRLRDWITTPKLSGYESLHTTVLGPEDRWVEVQIRTERMDVNAEKGSAAHWKYKETAYGKNIDNWLLDVRNLLETIGTQRFDEQKQTNIDHAASNIYIFTPNGDLRELKNRATILDFAFEIHTDVGSKCVGGKINGKIHPIRYQLKNGDKVEIITAKNQRPNPDWLNVVVTSKAKSRIARALREQKFKEAEIGKDILYRKFKNWKIELNERELNKIIKFYGFKLPVDLYFNIATGKIDLQDVKQIFKTSDEIEERISTTEKPINVEELIENRSEKDLGYITIESGVSNLNYSLAKCCNPIAGDRIFGFVTVNQGIKVHRMDCPNAEQMLTKYPYRVIKARWKESQSTKVFITNLRVIGMDRVGILNDITKVISEDLRVNMKSVNFKSAGSGFEGVIKVQVRDVEHLGYLRQRLLKIKGVIKVVRFD